MGVDSREQVRTLDGILRVGALVLTCMVVGSAWGPGLGLGLRVYGPGVALHLLHLVWLRRRPSRWVAVSHCLLYFVWVTGILALRAGGMAAPAGMVYPPLVLMAGLVWSGRAALGMAALTSVAGLLLVLLQTRGLLPAASDGNTPMRLWAVMTACVVVTAALIRFALGTLARSNEERLNNERRYADLVRASPDVMLFVDAGRIVRGANPALHSRFGMEPQAVIGQPLTELPLFDAAGAAALVAQIEATRADGTPRTEERSARAQAGHTLAVEVHSYRIDGDLVCVSLRDLSERERRRSLEERLKEGQRLEALGRLAGGVAHDFNNLLMVILASSDLLRRAQHKPPAELTAIEDAAKRASQLTRQLLAFGRRQVLVAESVELNAAVQKALPLLQRLLHEELKLQFTPSVSDCHAVVDRSQLDQILINLVANARDAMPDGGTVHIEVGPQPDNWVGFHIRDTGAGMAPELLERIFEPFFTTKREQGTGLGLATVHGIVTQSGGLIRVHSTPGAGSTFVVSLPRAQRPQQSRERTSTEPQAPRSVRVLVVEDEAAVRTVIRAILESGGHRVVTADSGVAALEALQAADPRFELLLTDVVMPGMNGPQLAARARELQPGLQVLYTSGHTAELLDARGVLQSRDHFIAKPFAARELLRRVEQVTAGHLRAGQDAPA